MMLGPIPTSENIASPAMKTATSDDSPKASGNSRRVSTKLPASRRTCDAP